MNRDELSQTQIPWSHRQRLGWVKAFLLTGWRTIANIRSLGIEASRQLYARDARLFWWVCYVLAVLPPVAGIVWAFFETGGSKFLGFYETLIAQRSGFYKDPTPFEIEFLIPFSSGAGFYPTIPAAILLCILLINGAVQSWFAQPSLTTIQRERAVALSRYTLFPLTAAIWLAGGIALIGWMGNTLDMDGLWDADIGGIIIVLGLELAAIFLVILYWINILRLLSAATQMPRGKLALAAIMLPLQWAVCVFVSLVAFPWAVGFLRQVIESLV